jgi:hypothetical protein
MPLISGIGSPQAISSASGGKVYAVNTLTEAGLTTVLQPNPQRVSITFHNPGAHDLRVGPSVLVDGSANSFTNAAPGGSFLVFANGGTLVITGECQVGWRALSVTGAGTNNPITTMESNI